MQHESRDAHSRSDTDYPQLHDFARHTIHSTETLGVALNTVDSMIRQQNLLLEKTQQGQRDNVKALLQTRQYMQFQHQMLANLKSRSEANGLRLQNEINLVGVAEFVSLDAILGNGYWTDVSLQGLQRRRSEPKPDTTFH